jgi:hypothetical protein
VGEGMPGHPFIGSEGERGGRASERNGQWRWMRHNGGGGGHFGRGSVGVVVGSDDGGAPAVMGAEGALGGDGCDCQSREEDDRARPACR